MKQVLVDTDSLFFRGDELVAERMRQYMLRHSVISFSVLTWYEIVSGLRHRDAKRQLQGFLEFAEASNVIPLSQDCTEKAAELYALTRKQGTPVDDVDILIAGTALANNMAVATHNRRHFGCLPGVELEDWSTQA